MVTINFNPVQIWLHNGVRSSPFLGLVQPLSMRKEARQCKETQGGCLCPVAALTVMTLVMFMYTIFPIKYSTDIVAFDMVKYFSFSN